MILRPPRTTLTDTPFPSTRLFRSVDVSSPVLMLYCSNGKHFEEATLVVRKAGGANPLKYLMIKMTKVMVTAVSTGGSGGEDRLTENIPLRSEEHKSELQSLMRITYAVFCFKKKKKKRHTTTT